MSKILLPSVILLLLIVIFGFTPMPLDKVVFLDVGQGDAILIQHNTSQILIDGGRGTAVLPKLAEELPWFDRTIEVVIATHPDQDHIEGLLHVLKRYEIKLVLLPKVPHETKLQSQWLTDLKNALEERDVAYRFAWQGQTIKTGDLQLRILAPNDTNGMIHVSKSNDASIVTRLDMHGRSFLLTGDAEKKAETALVHTHQDTDLLDVEILQAGHHGSNTSTHQAILEATSPGMAVMSVGADNSYGHPHPAVLERLGDIRLWRTDQNGSIRFIFNGDKLFVATEK